MGFPRNCGSCGGNFRFEPWSSGVSSAAFLILPNWAEVFSKRSQIAPSRRRCSLPLISLARHSFLNHRMTSGSSRRCRHFECDIGWGGIPVSTAFSTVFFIRFSARVLGGFKDCWWGRWDLNPRPPGFSRFRSRAGYHTMLDNGPKRRNRATVPNSIFLKLAGNSPC